MRFSKFLSAISVTTITISLFANGQDGNLGQVEYFKQIGKANEEMLNAVPNPFDCTDLSWLDHCDLLLKYYKMNPQVTIRIADKAGTVHSFSPETPPSMINFQMNPTAENARKHFDDLNKQMAAALKAHYVGKMTNLAGGGLTSLDSYGFQGGNQINLPRDKLRLGVFVTQKSYHDAQISELAKFKKRHPHIPITVYLVSGATNNFIRDIKQLGLEGRVLSASEQSMVSAKVTSFPTIWIEYDEKKRRNVLNTHHTASMLENAVLATFLMEDRK